MRMTESRLRSIIRQVIKESDSESYDWYSKWLKNTEKLNFNKACEYCFKDLGMDMIDADSEGKMASVVSRYMNDRGGINKSELESILENISSVSEDNDVGKKYCMFTASLGLLIEKGVLKVNLDFLTNESSRKNLKKDEIVLIGAMSDKNNRLSSALCYSADKHFYVISPGHFNSKIYSRKAASARSAKEELEAKAFDDQRLRAEDRKSEEKKRVDRLVRDEFGLY